MAPLKGSAALRQAWGWASWELPRLHRRATGRWATQPGAWVLLAVAGLLLNGAAWRWSQARQAEQALRAAATAMAAEQASVTAAARAAHARIPTQVDRAAFDALLVRDDHWSNVLHDLLDSAQTKGVEVLSGDYSAQADAANRFTRKHIGMPVRGEANAVRGFIEDSLRKHPGLAIQSLQFKRAAVAESKVEARVDWVLLSQFVPQAEGRP